MVTKTVAAIVAALAFTTASAFAQVPTCPRSPGADPLCDLPHRALQTAGNDEAWDLSGERPATGAATSQSDDAWDLSGSRPASLASHGVDTSPTSDGQSLSLTKKD
jgi:hypothetical protein